MPSILANLDHRHSYVRKHAVLAINAIYKLPKGELMLQDVAETIEKLLRSEQDLSTKRNAFAMLTNHGQDKAVRYLFEHIEQISTWGDILQMAALELIRKVCRSTPAEKGKYIKVSSAPSASSGLRQKRKRRRGRRDVAGRRATAIEGGTAHFLARPGTHGREQRYHRRRCRHCRRCALSLGSGPLPPPPSFACPLFLAKI